VIDPMPPFWVTGAVPAGGTVQVDPVVVAEQAAKQLGLSSPVIEMAPPDGSPQLVGLASWLWVNPDAATWSAAALGLLGLFAGALTIGLQRLLWIATCAIGAVGLWSTYP
jgi:hypothetical protein